MSIPWVFTSTVLFIFGAMALYLGYNPDVRFYLASGEGGGQIIVAVLSVSVGVLGIVWAFHAESERIKRIEENIFKRSFGALIGETAGNYAAINKLKGLIKPNQFNFLTLSSEIAKSILGNPLTYKYTGEEYILALSAYLTTLDLANKWLSFIWEDFKADGNISEKNIADLVHQLDDCKYYLLILQIQTQLYVHAYNVQMGPLPGNSEEIRGWLHKKTPISIAELEDNLREMDKLEPSKVNELRKGLKRAVRD